MTSRVKLDAARELIISDHFEAARAVLATMPASPTAQKWLAKMAEIAPTDSPTTQWEYLEVFVSASERLPTDVAAMIMERPATTVDHYYTRLLNEYGADGWELLSEVLQGGDFYRLLFKRPKRVQPD